MQLDERFAAAEQDGAATVGAGTPADFNSLVEYVRRTVSQLDERSAVRLAMDPPQSAAEVKELWQDVDYERGILTNPEDPRRDELVSWMSDRVLKHAGAKISDAGTDAKFAEIVRRGLLELVRRKSDRLQDCHERPFYDALFDPARPPSVPFGELAKIYVAQVEEEHQQNKVSAKRTDKIKAIVNTLLEIVGKDFPVHKIDDDVVRRIFGFLLFALPAMGGLVSA
jgi:hypothetical protein